MQAARAKRLEGDTLSKDVQPIRGKLKDMTVIERGYQTFSFYDKLLVADSTVRA